MKTLDTKILRRCSSSLLDGSTLWVLTVLLAALALVACVEDDVPTPTEGAEGTQGAEGTTDGEAPELRRMSALQSALVEIPDLNTVISEYIQIDQLSGGPGDANLFTGNDPADGTASANLPAGPMGATYIDWNDLSGDLGNHRVVDETKAINGSDSTSFPGSDECVGDSVVLSKMDLTYIAVANNIDFAYFATARASNDGDAGYMWLATRNPPDQRDGESPCMADETRMLYDISGPDPMTGGTGDVLLVGQFAPSGGPLLRIFQAVEDRADVPAQDAVDYTDSSLWTEITNSTSAVAAVNTTVTDPDALGNTGFKKLQGGDLPPELFAELGIPLSVFTGGSSCGANYFLSIITRPSGSGGPNPDLKDFMLTRANFGSPAATAEIAGTCDENINYRITSITDFDGSPVTINTATCEWEFFDDMAMSVGTVSGPCSDMYQSFPVSSPGTYTATVDVLVPGGASCTASTVAGPTDVLEPIEATLVLDAGGGMCPGLTDDSATWSVMVSGGSGPYTYDWSDDAICTDNQNTCTYNPADSLFCATASFNVEVDDSSPLCPPVTTDNATYEKLTTVNAGVSPAP